MLSEGDVLVPLDPSLREDTDQWPEFTLNHVKITSQATGEPVSLLAAHGGFQVRVEGFLDDLDDENLSLLKSHAYHHQPIRNRPIVIPDVATYSFSLFEDGTFGFWAAGKAGWFEIASPSKSYKAIFEEMKEATGMFYYLADKYRKSRVFSKDSMKSVTAHVRYHFFEYLNSSYCHRDYTEDIRKVFYHHREFLIKSMLEGQEGLDWEASPVLKHLRRKFPRDASVIREIVSIAQRGSSDLRLAADVETKASKSQKASAKKAEAKRIAKDMAIDNISEGEEEDSIELEQSVPGSKKRKSTLRPKSNKAAKKSMTRRQSSRSLDEDDTIEAKQEDTSHSVSETEAFRAQNGFDRDFTPALLTNGSKNGEEGPNPKRSIWLDRNDEPLPSYFEPRGPGDTWTCPYDGCNFQVWDARTRASVDMIKNHFVGTHASGAEELIYQESRPWVTVGHLLEHIKGMASLKAQVGLQKPGLPSRVIRRY